MVVYGVLIQLGAIDRHDDRYKKARNSQYLSCALIDIQEATRFH
jgi:hypothetical protein